MLRRWLVGSALWSAVAQLPPWRQALPSARKAAAPLRVPGCRAKARRYAVLFPVPYSLFPILAALLIGIDLQRDARFPPGESRGRPAGSDSGGANS